MIKTMISITRFNGSSPVNVHSQSPCPIPASTNERISQSGGPVMRMPFPSCSTTFPAWVQCFSPSAAEVVQGRRHQCTIYLECRTISKTPDKNILGKERSTSTSSVNWSSVSVRFHCLLFCWTPTNEWEISLDSDLNLGTVLVGSGSNRTLASLDK